MPLEIIRNDITKMEVDAIVNPTNATLHPSGGTDAAIHRVAGGELLEACQRLKDCEVGQAKITDGYHLPAKYVIHTVGPKWIDGRQDEAEFLADCYRSSLSLAKAYDLQSIAIPLIAAGAFGFPREKALEIATKTIGEFLLEEDMQVFLVVFDKSTFKLSEKLFTSIKTYIDDNYFESQANETEIYLYAETPVFYSDVLESPTREQYRI